MATIEQINKCINTVAPLAVAEYKKGKKILPSVCIAQACCESAYMTSPKMIRANALFGIKVGKSAFKFGKAWKGKAYSTLTKECYDGLNYTQITDMFRAYDTVAEAVEDYYDILTTATRYKGAVGKATARETITAIKNAGYATDPNYINTIMSIINRYGLSKYDITTGVVHPAEYYPPYTGNSTSIIQALKSLGIPSDFTTRKMIATANGINGYTGTAEQNIRMLVMLKGHDLKRI